MNEHHDSAETSSRNAHGMNAADPFQTQQMAYAQVQATLSLAYEQRTANMIAAYNQTTRMTMEGAAEIQARLGHDEVAQLREAAKSVVYDAAQNCLDELNQFIAPGAQEADREGYKKAVMKLAAALELLK